jgi:LPXTG-site transpeptidase (sortase) family protein
MYRQRQVFTARAIVVLVVLGIIGGVGFFIYDNLLRANRPLVAPTPIMDLPTAAAIASTPEALPTVAPTPLSINLPTPFPDSTLFIPSAGIYAPIITAFIRGGTWDVTHLGTSVGYLQGTSWITGSSAAGNVVLSGHVELAGGQQGVFAPLMGVQVGDQVVLSENGVNYTYTVLETKYVAPDDLSILQPQGGRALLTLITCSDYSFISNTYEQRFVVVAEQAVTS